MYDNQNFPWYLQQSPRFLELYNGVFPLAEKMTPLGMGEVFNLELMTGDALINLCLLWGLRDAMSMSEGMVYSVDKWSTGKVWSGKLTIENEELFRNFLRMKIHINSRPLSLTLIYEALEILLKGYDYKASVTEEDMRFIINIEASAAVIDEVRKIRSYDSIFLGHIPGISYLWNYVVTD